jgi:Fe-S-cluster containining protein
MTELADQPSNNQPHPPDPIRADLDAALRHLHFMGMQTKHDMVDLTSKLYAIIEELIAGGQIDLRRFEARQQRLREKEEARMAERVHVQVADPIDKYALEDLPVIDCAARLPLCKARCCKLLFPLSFQDLDERIVLWDYANPYRIRQRTDGYCVHWQADNGCCNVYAQRPVACRTYDCRNDKRIWLDFEQRIPAPDQAGEDDQLGSEPENS